MDAPSRNNQHRHDTKRQKTFAASSSSTPSSSKNNKSNFKNNNHNNHNNHNNQKPKQCAKEIIRKLHSCGKEGKPKEAEQYLQTMQALYEQGDADMRPDFRHYNSLMHAWVKSNCKHKEYSAQSILEWMCNLQTNGNGGGTSNNGNGNGNGNGAASNNEHLKPTNVSFNICINAWRGSKEKNATDVAWYLFESMVRMEEGGHMSGGPDYHTCKVMIHALSNRVVSGTAHKAERVLQIMIASNRSNCQPDASIYNQIMHIYSHNKERNAPLKCEKLLRDMHERYLQGDESLQPTTLTFNSLLNTYAKSNSEGAADRSEMILQHMQEMFEGGYEMVEPGVISFNTVINAHASSKKKGADRRAYNILF